MNTPVAEFYPGSLVSARGREWIVLPESTTDTLRLRPLGGGEKDESLIYLPLELQPVGPATGEARRLLAQRGAEDERRRLGPR